MNSRPIITSDGSNTLYLEEMDETYHSKHGAIAESKHIFIQHGLLAKSETDRKIKVFEVGFGTGLNAILTQFVANEEELEVDYISVELYPLGQNLINQLNYAELLSIDVELIQAIHKSEWGVRNTIANRFELIKLQEDLTKMKIPNELDVVYFDAFAPEKQEEMWSEEIFKNIYTAMNSNGILVTYCVKGEIRRRLKSIGFQVEKLKGPEGGKREMMRAIKP